MGRGIEWDKVTLQYARTRIGWWTQSISERLRIPRSEREDIQQEFWVDLIYRARRYKPERSSPNTFIARLVFNRAQELLALYGHGKRRIWRGYRSLNSPVVTKARDAVGERLSFDSQDFLLDREDDANDLGARERRLRRRITIDIRISMLPEDLAWLAKRLKFESLTEIARDTGIPRPTLHGRMRKLRPYFDDLR